MKKTKKIIIAAVTGVLLLLAAAVGVFFAAGNRIISGMFLRDGSSCLIADDEGRIVLLHDPYNDKFTEYNSGDIITVVGGKKEQLYGGKYGTRVESHYSFRTKAGSKEDIAAFFEKAGKTVLEGRFLRSKNGDLMLIDERGSAYQLCLTDVEEKSEYYSFLGDGDKFYAVCGYIREIYPAQADMYYCWYVEDGTYADLPESTLESLREMGWID